MSDFERQILAEMDGERESETAAQRAQREADLAEIRRANRHRDHFTANRKPVRMAR